MAQRKKVGSGRGGARPGAGRPRQIQDPVQYRLVLERRDWEALNDLARQVRQGFYGQEVQRIQIASPRDGAALPADHLLEGVSRTAVEGQVRVHVIAPSHASNWPTAFEALPAGGFRFSFPEAFLRNVEELYDTDLYWWLEVRDAGGRQVAYSTMQRLTRAPR